MKRAIFLLTALILLGFLQPGKARAIGCHGTYPIICENSITYYPSSPDSVVGPLTQTWFNASNNKWVTLTYCSVTWSAPVKYSGTYFTTDSRGGCAGWWSTGLNYINLTVQYPGQGPTDGSYWVGAADRLP